MKQLILLVIIILISFCSAGAQYGTLIDKESHIQINYPGGDTILFSKIQTTVIKTRNQEVYILNSQRWGVDDITKILKLIPVDFGFNTAGALRSYISDMIFKNYRITYHYTNGLLDTLSHYVGDSLAFRIAYQYSGSDIIQKSAPINQ